MTTLERTAADIPRFNGLVYASASFGAHLLSRTTAAWLIFFYAPPPEAGLATIVPRFGVAAILLAMDFVDAVDDPLIGYWSDRTRSRWGRRIPFVVLATPLYAMFFFLLWTPPGGDGGYLAPVLYFSAILLAQRITGTLSTGPLEALLPEIARTTASRMRIVAWQFVFGSLGAAVGLVATGVMKDQLGFPTMAAVVAALAVASRYVGLSGAWRYARVDVEPVRIGLRRSLREAARNRPFLCFLPTFVFFNMAILLLTAAMPFYAEAVVLGGRESIQIDVAGLSVTLREGAVSSILFGSALCIVLASLPLVYRLVLRRGKAWVYSRAMLLGCVTLPLLFFMGFVPGIDPLAQSVVFLALAGLPMVGVFALPNAILSDIIDYDALRTGMRREALYFGAQNTIEKWTASLAFPALALLLFFGETSADPLGIRLVGPVAGVAAAVGFLFFRGYDLPDTVTAETVARERAAPSG